ncbi:MAG: 2-C-methyl-D-erythritol 4-phosphate cytidylyltransferase [Thermodesulfobacteriaceae bacterium]|nr:2-C-methyl-D-erythritol 4-phosphate cytidylyltransferase [Thermodesulfobacteriaceae bacterium]MCX8041107.1 2-C-methyl-D-erythritol 4-phosphate cytidylyltransferase [Thermodesulfobacteriaceae bacterium]MDW8135548.1 2-C-methyl-D-erythritol 4-phosphate cytidylyltransferase [Thermodesulfobacterium sp.]
MIVAIIPAAGEGKRVGFTIPKQFFSIKDVPLIIYTLKTFENHPQVDEIIVATSSNYLNYLEKLVIQHRFKKVKKIILGGETRQASVWAGVRAAPYNTEIFLVHDAVRPFISANLITKIIEATLKYQAAIPAIPVRDTLTQVEGGWLKKNFPREGLYQVQTPQGIKAEILRFCLNQAEKENLLFPDESSLLLHFGYFVKMVEGSLLNFKITYPEDLILTQKLMEGKIISLLEGLKTDEDSLDK